MAIPLQITDDSEAEETIRFVRMFDRFFDCLNVSSFTAGKFSRKAFRSPYQCSTDFRLKVDIAISITYLL